MLWGQKLISHCQALKSAFPCLGNCKFLFKTVFEATVKAKMTVCWIKKNVINKYSLCFYVWMWLSSNCLVLFCCTVMSENPNLSHRKRLVPTMVAFLKKLELMENFDFLLSSDFRLLFILCLNSLICFHAFYFVSKHAKLPLQEEPRTQICPWMKSSTMLWREVTGWPNLLTLLMKCQCPWNISTTYQVFEISS